MIRSLLHRCKTKVLHLCMFLLGPFQGVLPGIFPRKTTVLPSLNFSLKSCSSGPTVTPRYLPPFCFGHGRDSNPGPMGHQANALPLISVCVCVCVYVCMCVCVFFHGFSFLTNKWSLMLYNIVFHNI